MHYHYKQYTKQLTFRLPPKFFLLPFYYTPPHTHHTTPPPSITPHTLHLSSTLLEHFFLYNISSTIHYSLWHTSPYTVYNTKPPLIALQACHLPRSTKYYTTIHYITLHHRAPFLHPSSPIPPIYHTQDTTQLNLPHHTTTHSTPYLSLHHAHYTIHYSF